MATEIQANRIYILTNGQGQETVHVSLRRADYGWKMTRGISILDDGRVVEGSVGADGRYYVDAEYGTLANLDDVGAREDVEARAAAEAHAIRTNCHLDAPDGYTHTLCETEGHVLRCPFDLDPHFGCDHQDAPCQARGERHIPCQRLGWNPCPQCATR